MKRFACLVGVALVCTTGSVADRDLHAQTVAVRAIAVNNHNRNTPDNLLGGAVQVRGQLGQSGIWLRAGVDHAGGRKEMLTSTCQGLVPPGMDCGAEDAVSRSGFWMWSLGLGVPLLRRERVSVLASGGVDVAELAVRIHGQRTQRLLKGTDPLLGGSGGVTATWTPKSGWPLAIEAEVMLGAVGQFPGTGATDTFEPGKVDFRRYSLGLAWRP
ncbi:hypothetical protein [Gemmatimonas sp.]|uniref:hypothetical protein n=1 Tax=Gemmatimonas sp. TaxID=1962908 RepID=UPI002EDB5CFB